MSAGKVVLDPDNPSDVLLLARVEWDQASVTGLPFESLSTKLQSHLLKAAEAKIRALAGAPGVTVLREAPRAA